MKAKAKRMIQLIVATALAVSLSAGTASAVFTDETLEQEIHEWEILQNVTVEQSTLKHVLIQNGQIGNSKIDRALIQEANVEGSYLGEMTLLDAKVADSRIDRATLFNASLQDATLCKVYLNLQFLIDECRLVTLEEGDENMTTHARLVRDAPAEATPGGTYEIEVRGVDASALTIRNDPPGVKGLGFAPQADPLNLTHLGFEAAAGPQSIANMTIFVHDEVFVPDEETPDNDTDDEPADGNVTNGNATDGNITNGNVTDGNATDGNATDGNATDGNATDGNATDGNATDGNATDGNATDGNATDNVTGAFQRVVVATIENVTLDEEIALPEGASNITLRVNLSETDIIDGSRLALAMDLDDHTLRTNVTELEVEATQFAFLDMANQTFAPFLADDVARLVLSAPTDEHGNVDRDVNISMSVEVTSIDNESLVGDAAGHARLHDDSRLFSDEPFNYDTEVDMAHHPQTLELVVRQQVNPDVTYGDFDAYGTHLVAISPYATNVTLTATATLPDGSEQEDQMDLTLNATPEEGRNVTFFGKDYGLPGLATLEVSFVGANNTSVASGDDWSLFVHETPTSHNLTESIAIPSNVTSFQQELAGSVMLGAPFGNFLESRYRVCVEHDGLRDCAEDNETIPLRTGETTSVEIRIR